MYEIAGNDTGPLPSYKESPLPSYKESKKELLLTSPAHRLRAAVIIARRLDASSF